MTSNSEPVESEPRPSLPTILWRFGIVALLVLADLWSKTRIFEFLQENRAELQVDVHGHLRYPIFGEWFAFMRSRNAGAAFGQLDSFPYLLISGRSVAVLFLSYLIIRSSPSRRIFTLALMLVLSGATGNLMDNLFLEPPIDHPFGEVRDFIDVYFPTIGEDGWHFPTFNIADSCITVGAVLLLLSGLGEPKPEARVAPNDGAAAA